MLWLLALHIVALLVWSAALLYLTALLTGAESKPTVLPRTPHHHDSMERFIYTQIASPAALVGVTAGSAVFWVNSTIAFWLIAKLTLVTLLVALHAGMGLLVLRVERGELAGLRRRGSLLAALFCILLGLILWLVLAKPGVPGGWPWAL